MNVHIQQWPWPISRPLASFPVPIIFAVLLVLVCALPTTIDAGLGRGTGEAENARKGILKAASSSSISGQSLGKAVRFVEAARDDNEDSRKATSNGVILLPPGEGMAAAVDDDDEYIVSADQLPGANRDNGNVDELVKKIRDLPGIMAVVCRPRYVVSSVDDDDDDVELCYYDFKAETAEQADDEIFALMFKITTIVALLHHDGPHRPRVAHAALSSRSVFVDHHGDIVLKQLQMMHKTMFLRQDLTALSEIALQLVKRFKEDYMNPGDGGDFPKVDQFLQVCDEEVNAVDLFQHALFDRHRSELAAAASRGASSQGIRHPNLIGLGHFAEILDRSNQ